MNYLSEAANLLRRVDADNERAMRTAPEHRMAGHNETRVKLALMFAGLAAIERGIAPTDLLDTITAAAQQ